MRIKKGDQVKIISGKDRGKTGTVLRVMPEENKISVEGINFYKKRMRPKRQGQKGETVSVVRPLHFSNVMLVCKNCKEPARLGMRKEGNQKIRFCRKCQAST
ncbi:MAG: 50S ribosomal protein L24 [Candidatus Liptonbacteria bacterium]